MQDAVLDFVAGFIDADGSFQMALDKEPKNKIGFTAKTRITITNTDRQALEFVQQSLKESLKVGFIKKAYSALREQAKYDYIIASHKNCYKTTQLLKSHFCGSAAFSSFIFEAALHLVIPGKTRTKTGLAQYIYLMYKINSQGKSRKRSLSETLNLIEASHIPFNESLLHGLISIGVPTKEYIAGYTQGDGSFYITIDKNNVTRFGFQLTDDYKPLLDQMRTTFGACGQVYLIDAKTADENQPVYRYQLDTQNRLRLHILPVFQNSMLLGRQRERFLLWEEALYIQEAKGQDYKQKVKAIRDKLRAI